MITRRGGSLFLRQGNASAASRSLENSGYVVLRAVFDAREVAALAKDVRRVFATFPPDIRRSEDKSVRWEDFRYEILNRSAAGQKAVGEVCGSRGHLGHRDGPRTLVKDRYICECSTNVYSYSE